MEESRFKISRRQFLALAGAAGVAALGVRFFAGNEPYVERDYTIDSDKFREEFITTDVLVVGGGMAGLFSAVKAHDAGAKVLMVSKGRLGCSGQTPFAKGFFVFDSKTSPVSLDEFVELVSQSALGSNNRAYTRQLAMYSKDRAEELRKWGFFDSSLYHEPFRRPIDERGIRVMERIMITHLIRENGVIAGAAGFSLDEEKLYFFNAKSVVLCTGAGGFKPYGFPIRDLTHDGSVMAYEIGARITGKEWNDGHTTSSQYPAACYDSWHGIFENKPSITGVEIHHDLGVELNYATYIRGGPVSMGGQMAEVSGGPYVPEEFRRAAPSEGRTQGPPERGERPPPGGGGYVVGGASAGMSIHKSEGLVPINDRCATDIPGLYAAGDALGSHMSGGIYTQIGSSLAGSAVQGAIAGEEAANYAKDIDLQSIPESTVSRIREEILAPLNRDSGYSPAWVTQVLQGVMVPNFVLYIKKASILSAALAYVEELRDHHVPMLVARDLHELRLAHETKNMIVNAEMKLRASLFREESRLSHYRLDYPEIDDENWSVWVNIYKGSDGKMKLEKQPFGYWPNGDPIE
ncbi:FAD-dependent oxidoreductase [Archaeoglobus fulgidus]|uniref:Fumarate reductase, flavoprotein subunit (FdrA) (Mycobacterium tuberculosis) n=1 Tax=Archaeoglobus fulgidus (strain ATCC 49558 / DSM 4304 / JCM 9628 / NBRC 100126 / VC-16) TaxID=224325 RepID=O28809_ARCFU|nr:FAD-binding protein [Archaeoglobus fulgidus]AAB89784.1 fumarate reductase, flavoprotein subunit (fdrA) {Mycobacterium tuberculosis) [Archaeoglobus fulgidus DSM 4304]